MRQVLILAFFCLLTIVGLQAQHETLFNKARVVGGFGAPIFEWSLGNTTNTSVGGGGGIVIENFFIGGYGLGSVDFDALIEVGEVDNMELGHGGFWLGYTISPYKVVHLYSSARIGWGALNVDFRDGGVRYADLDKVFVMTPELGVELNVTRWFRVAGGVGYRWVNGVAETPEIKSDDFNDAVASLTLRFGWFGNRYKGRDNW